MSVPALTASRIDGPPGAPLLILGPSLGTSTLIWRDAAAILAERYTVVEWDLPGHGMSKPASAAFSMTELADAVTVIADELGARRFYYAGVSIGGAVGLELALGHSDRLYAAVTACSAAKIGEADAWQERAKNVREQGTAILVDASAKTWFAPDFISRSPELASALMHGLSDTDAESYALCCEALAAFDHRGDLSLIGVPVLALAGENDEVAPISCAREIASGVQNGRAMEIADAAHQASAEQPARVAALLVDFFTEGA